MNIAPTDIANIIINFVGSSLLAVLILIDPGGFASLIGRSSSPLNAGHIICTALIFSSIGTLYTCRTGIGPDNLWKGMALLLGIGSLGFATVLIVGNVSPALVMETEEITFPAALLLLTNAFLIRMRYSSATGQVLH